MSSYRSAHASVRHAVLIAALDGLSPAFAAAQAADPAGAQGPRETPPPPAPSPGQGQRIAGFSLIGVGVVSVAVGAMFGMSVPAKNRDIDAICPTGQPCPPQSVADYNNAVADAKIARAAALVGFGVGAVFLGTGVALVLTAPQRAFGTALWLTPALGNAGAGAAFGGNW
jgi:hypothetical protein